MKDFGPAVERRAADVGAVEVGTPKADKISRDIKEAGTGDSERIAGILLLDPLPAGIELDPLHGVLRVHHHNGIVGERRAQKRIPKPRGEYVDRVPEFIGWSTGDSHGHGVLGVPRDDIGREDAGTHFKVGADVALERPSLGVLLFVAADLTERAKVPVGVADPVFYRRGGFFVLRVAAASP